MSKFSESDRRLLAKTAFAVPKTKPKNKEPGTAMEKQMVKAELSRRFPGMYKGKK